MAVTCEGCGRCCEDQGFPPFADGEESVDLPPEALAALDGQDLGDRFRRRLPCLWYDAAAKGCRFYDHRPRACREFAVGDYFCLAYRTDESNGRVALPLW